MKSVENKLNVKMTLLLSFGFFASSMAWSLYNNYVPVILQGFLEDIYENFLKDFFNGFFRDFFPITTIISIIMVIDNIFGVIFQPLFGKLSDNTRTRFGRRMPFIIAGLPVCAVLFALIPYMPGLLPLMAVLILLGEAKTV